MNKYQKSLDEMGCALNSAYDEEIRILQELIDKETKYKTLEELGYVVVRDDKYIISFHRKHEYEDSVWFYLETKEFNVGELVDISFELLKAIELKMIELGLDK